MPIKCTGSALEVCGNKQIISLISVGLWRDRQLRWECVTRQFRSRWGSEGQRCPGEAVGTLVQERSMGLMLNGLCFPQGWGSPTLLPSLLPEASPLGAGTLTEDRPGPWRKRQFPRDQITGLWDLSWEAGQKVDTGRLPRGYRQECGSRA